MAQRANVSKMTVSRVINHPELVTPELKAIVYKAMDELDYRPNTAAKALAQSRTLIVKVLILEEMDITEPYYMHLLNGIAHELDKYHYSLQLVTENTVDLGGSDGYIITGMRRDDYEWIKELDKPVIVFGENDCGVPFVDSDNEKAVAEATEFALSKGYEHLIFVGIDVDAQFEAKREQGFLTSVEKSQVTQNVYRIENRSTIAAKLVTSLAPIQPNTCFVCASDRIAIGIERGLQSMQYSIPDEYGVIGFDSVFLDQIASPMLTTMKQHVVEMGKMCVSQLMRLIDEKPIQSPHYYFDATLIERGTTRK